MIKECIIETDDDLTARNSQYLILLYQPLMGRGPTALYHYLVSVAAFGRPFSMEDLHEFSTFTPAQFERFRKALERFRLVDTLLDEGNERMILQVHRAMNPDEFLNDIVFSRMIVMQLSAAKYRGLAELFGLYEKRREDLVNISESMNIDHIEESWSSAKEEALANSRPQMKKKTYRNFNWSLFFKGQGRSIPERVRSEFNLTSISNLAVFFKADEIEMRKHVVRCLDQEKVAIDFNQLTRNLLKQRNRKYREPRSDFELPPVLYLQKKSGGTYYVSEEEADFLQWLDSGMNMTYEVINTLLDYCLEQCNQQFNENYIRKVAGTWQRSHIQTREEALAFLDRGTKKRIEREEKRKPRNSELPEWFYHDNETADEELISQVLALQKQMKESENGQSG